MQQFKLAALYSTPFIKKNNQLMFWRKKMQPVHKHVSFLYLGAIKDPTWKLMCKRQVFDDFL